MQKPRIGIIPGDPSGIGPELVAKLLAQDEVVEGADILLIGDDHVFAAGAKVAGETLPLSPLDARDCDWSAAERFALHRMETIDAKDIEMASAVTDLDIIVGADSESSCGTSISRRRGRSRTEADFSYNVLLNCEGFPPHPPEWSS